MLIGVAREIKEHEYRVSMTPEGASEIIQRGHSVMVEQSAGSGSGFSDQSYEERGARIVARNELFASAELIVKVKEPLPGEYILLQKGQALFTFLHLASAPELVRTLLDRGVAGFAYETLEVNGSLPLLKPMSEVAGKMAPIMGAFYSQKLYGGGGVLVTGADDVSPARVVILGAGTVGMNALQVANGMGADIVVINRGEEKLKRIEKMYDGKVRTGPASSSIIGDETVRADILIGAVLIPGARAPRLVSRDTVKLMKDGAVIVDVSVDQGGCIETTRPTTHNDPVYTVDGVIHYTVANMPGAYPRTSTLALTSKTLPYIVMLADMGIEKAAAADSHLRSALNTYRGMIMHSAISRESSL